MQAALVNPALALAMAITVGIISAAYTRIIERFPQFTQDIDANGKRRTDALVDPNRRPTTWQFAWREASGEVIEVTPTEDAGSGDEPVAVSAEITGPGSMFDSTPSLPPGLGLDHYGYEAKEYFVSGTAQGQPYTTRIVVRKPTNNARFSGLVVAESMHGSGAAHIFEFTSHYTMSSGHAAVEILTTSPMQFVELNAERYKTLQLTDVQRNEILAQVGSLVRSGAPLAGLAVRKMVLGGTSQTAGHLIAYLPAHIVYRTPKMERIYDGFMPTSNGSNITQDVDVPIIHVPTMHEVSGQTITWRQDSDDAGKQYRVYEFSGMAHVDTRDAARMMPNPCAQPLSAYPLQAYMSVALNHLFNWVDKGVVAPRADRIWLDRSEADGSPMALDENGNPRGGIRSPYVDLPVVKYRIRPQAANPPIPNPSQWIVEHGPQSVAQMCGLSAYQTALSKDDRLAQIGWMRGGPGRWPASPQYRVLPRSGSERTRDPAGPGRRKSRSRFGGVQRGW